MISKNVFKFSKSSMFAMAMSVAVIFSGCKDDEEEVVVTIPTPTPAAATPTAKVMVVHASPDAPGVGLLVDDVLINTSAALEYPTNTGYLTVNAGTRNIKVNAYGTSTTVIQADLPLDTNVNYTVFAAGELATISPLVLVDDLTPPAAGKAHVRFVHLSPDAPAVDVLANGGVLFGDYSYTGYSAFTPVVAGTYVLSVNASGTATEVLNVGSVVLEEGKIYTVFAKGFLSGSGGTALGAEIIVNN